MYSDGTITISSEIVKGEIYSDENSVMLLIYTVFIQMVDIVFSGF